MGYRKVTYLEQIWYLIKYGLKHGFSLNEKKEKIKKCGLPKILQINVKKLVSRIFSVYKDKKILYNIYVKNLI